MFSDWDGDDKEEEEEGKDQNKGEDQQIVKGRHPKPAQDSLQLLP